MNSGAERATALTSFLLLAALVGMVVSFMQRPDLQIKIERPIDPSEDPRGHAEQARAQQLQERFEQAVAMLHAKQYEYAVTALHRVIELSPRMPEAYVNMGYALIGLERYKAAADFFNTAIELRPYQANAYWGLAVSLEAAGDLPGALGAMRTYIHLAPPSEQEYVRRARAALWEWETALKEGPRPQAEQEWIERRGREWEERNSPARDFPQAQPQVPATVP